jgi:hypothetical protein
MELENTEDINDKNVCFFCHTDLKGIGLKAFCPKCVIDLDPKLFPISNIENSAHYSKLPDGRQNECMKIFGPRNQHWYHCATCFPKAKDRGKGYCIYCAMFCAKNKHKLQLHYCAFICDSK